MDDDQLGHMWFETFSSQTKWNQGSSTSWTSTAAWDPVPFGWSSPSCNWGLEYARLQLILNVFLVTFWSVDGPFPVWSLRGLIVQTFLNHGERENPLYTLKLPGPYRKIIDQQELGEMNFYLLDLFGNSSPAQRPIPAFASRPYERGRVPSLFFATRVRCGKPFCTNFEPNSPAPWSKCPSQTQATSEPPNDDLETFFPKHAWPQTYSKNETWMGHAPHDQLHYF